MQVLKLLSAKILRTLMQVQEPSTQSRRFQSTRKADRVLEHVYIQETSTLRHYAGSGTAVCLSSKQNGLMPWTIASRMWTIGRCRYRSREIVHIFMPYGMVCPRPRELFCRGPRFKAPTSRDSRGNWQLIGGVICRSPNLDLGTQPSCGVMIYHRDNLNVLPCPPTVSCWTLKDDVERRRCPLMAQPLNRMDRALTLTKASECPRAASLLAPSLTSSASSPPGYVALRKYIAGGQFHHWPVRPAPTQRRQPL